MRRFTATGSLRHVDPQHRRRTVGRRVEPLEDLDERGLAGTVGPEDPEDLARGTSKETPASATRSP
jgi:hypothetical protein